MDKFRAKRQERARVWTFEEGAEQKGRELRVLTGCHREFSTCFEAALTNVRSVGPKRAQEGNETSAQERHKEYRT